jgi:ankyrin repeat protein
MSGRLALLLAAVITASCGAAPPSADELRNDPHEALVWAARTGDVSTIARLATSGMDLDSPDVNRNHWTPLQHAVHKQQAESVRVLLEWGASPDATQPGNTTPLFMAADSHDPTIVRLLVDAGADVDWIGPGKRTPLTQAISGGALWDVMDRPVLGGCRTETVRVLLKSGATPTPRTKAWNQAIWWARAHDCADVLVSAGSWPSHTMADKIVTAGGVVKDLLGVPSPKDVRERMRATPAPSRP